MEDIHWARYEEVSGDSVPSRHHFPQISMCSPTQKLINVSLLKRLGLTYIYTTTIYKNLPWWLSW